MLNFLISRNPLTSAMSTGYPWLLMMGMVLPLQHLLQQELPLESVLQQDPVTIQVEFQV